MAAEVQAEALAEQEPEYNYDFVRELGSGSFGKCWLANDKTDGEQVAVKFIPRGKRVDRNVEREVMYHSQLHHANVVGFKRVFVTHDALALVLELANGGELFDKVKNAGCFKEDMARFFFQQLLSGVEYLHECGVAHRDLKLENTLIRMEQSAPGRSPTPVLKISDFGFCKHDQLDTPPKSRVGTPAYISPEVLGAPTQYNGKAADVWAIGVHLYIMLVGWYPFTDPRAPHDFSKTAHNIQRGRFAFPSKVPISEECKELITRMLHRDAERRITIPEIQAHSWYRKNLSREIAEKGRGLPCYPACTQPLAEIQAVLRKAATTHDGHGDNSEQMQH